MFFEQGDKSKKRGGGAKAILFEYSMNNKKKNKTNPRNPPPPNPTNPRTPWPLVINSCQMMSAATFFGLTGPKAPFFWARFPRFGGCAIPARAVFCHFWAFFAKK
jgi:hypothetical protein